MSGLTQVTSDVISTNTISGLISAGFTSMNVATMGTQTIDFGSSNTLVFRANTSTERMRITTTGQVAVSANGSASAPIISKSDDLNTGIFFPAADTIAFSEGGTESMRIDSSGNLGIGTSSPSFPLTLGNNKQFGALNTAGGNVTFAIVNGSNNLVFGDDSVNTGTLTVQSRGGTLFNVNLTERMRLDNAGNLGIGTNSPNATYRLDVIGNSGIRIQGGTVGSVAIRAASGYANFVNFNENTVADRGVIGFAAGSANMQIRTNGAFDLSNGTLSATINQFGIGVGSATPTSGTGITFPATPSLSSNANTLDDYEEGSWTPAWVLGSGSLTNSYASGFYVKIGRTVYLTGYFGFGTASGSPSASATVALGGFPFTSTQSGFGQGQCGMAFLQPNYGWNTAPYNQIAIQQGGVTRTTDLFRFNTTWAPASTSLQYQDLQTSFNHSQIVFSAIYTTDQ